MSAEIIRIQKGWAAMNRIDETNDERKAVERWENEGGRWLGLAA